jgi:DNA-directed RNA polymerase specialized sigma24 family protein
MAHRSSAAGSTFLHAGWCARAKADRGAASERAGVQPAACDDPFEPHLAKIALFCLRMAGDRDKATAVAERVLARARRTVASSREAASFTMWLYAIVREECLPFARQKPASASSEVARGAAEEVP